MMLLSDPEASPGALLKQNSVDSLRLLKKYTNEKSGGDDKVFHEIAPAICKELEIHASSWNWLSPAPANPLLTLYLEVAITCFENCTDSELSLQLMLAISQYMNADVPWSNSHLAAISRAIHLPSCLPHLPKFADQVFSRFLSISSQKFATVPSRHGAKSRFTKARVSLPALGLQISSTQEENERAQWKSSANVTSLASVVLLLLCDKSSQYTAKCVSFTLNVMDDSDASFRAQGCFLLRHLVDLGHGDFLVRSGLLSVLEESVKTCLTYIPSLTPAEVSLRLLKDAAYPVLFCLFSISPDKSYITYLEVLDAHVLASISHIIGRDNDAVTNELLTFLFGQISVIIRDFIELSVLACFSRLNFVLCQSITNPYLVETEKGDLVVEAALNAQSSVLALCEKDDDLQACELILQYKLDFMAAWAILAKRVVKYGVGTTELKSKLRECFNLLKKVAEKSGHDAIDEDLEAVLTKVPELRELL